MANESDLSSEDPSFVRPFVITRGRTVGDAGELALETLVIATGTGHGRGPDHAAVVQLCTGEALSIFEIAIQMDQPIGVARVLVADLTAGGFVEQYDTAESENEALVKRLLEGIRAL